MKKSIKYWSVFLLLITSLIISIPVYAQSTDPYQAIIDKLNEEYSMDMYFMEEDDPLFTEGILSSSRMRITMTPEEFEADLRQCIIENNRAKAEADRKWLSYGRKILLKQVVDLVQTHILYLQEL